MNAMTTSRVRLHRLLAASVAVAAILSPPGAAHATVGVAAAVNVDAKGQPPGSTARVITLGQTVVFNEEIVTDGRGLVQVLLLDGTTFTVGPNSQLRIDEFVFDPNSGDAKVVATVAKGAFRFIGGQTSRKPGGATIRTPVGTIGIRGAMVEGNVAGRSALFSMVFGTEVRFTGTDGTGARLYKAGYTMVVDGAGGSIDTSTRRRTQQDAATFQTALAGGGGQTGGAARQPTDVIVAASPVAPVNSQLPESVRVPPTRPAVVSTEPDKVEDNVAQIDQVAGSDVRQDVVDGGGDSGGTPVDPRQVRALTAASSFDPASGPPVSNPGRRGLVGGSAGADRTITLGYLGGRLVSMDGSGINLPDLSGTAGDAGLVPVAVNDGTSPSGSLTGTAYAGRGDFAAYFLGVNGNPHNPFYVIAGTPVNLAAIEAAGGNSDIRQYSLTPDPIRPGTVPFFATDLYGATGAASTNFVVVEPGASAGGAWEAYLSWIDIQGHGAAQKSAAMLFSSASGTAPGGADSFSGERLGSFRPNAGTGPVSMGGTMGTIGNGGGSHFFGPRGEHLVLGPSLDPADAFFDRPLAGGFTGSPADGYLGDGTFGTHHVGNLITETPASAASRTSRTHEGFMAGMADSSAPSSGTAYALLSVREPVLTLEIDAVNNKLRAQAEVIDAVGGSAVVDSYLLTFGDQPGGTGGGTFVDDNMFGATSSANLADTRLNTDSGQNLAHAASARPGSYLISGRAQIMPDFQHCPTCDFIDWGWWGTRATFAASGSEIPETRTDVVHMGTWVAGDITGLAELPNTIVASFAGTAIGSVARTTPSGTATYIATGEAGLRYDFNLRQGDVQITNFDGISVSGTVYEDDLTTDALFYGDVLGGGTMPGSAVDGTVVGAFVNDGTEHFSGFIGDFEFSGTGFSAVGTLAGYRTGTAAAPPSSYARLLTDPGTFVQAFDVPLPNAGSRGLVGSTPASDRRVGIYTGTGRFEAADGTFSLPNHTGSDGDSGLETFTGVTGTSTSGALSGTVHAGAGDFAAYMMSVGGDPTRPYFLIRGTGTDLSAARGPSAFDIREYSLTADPVHNGPLPFFATDLYGPTSNHASTDFVIVEPGASASGKYETFMTWLDISGSGVNQKSATFVHASAAYDNAVGNEALGGSRRGSFRYAATAGAANMRGAMGSLAGQDGGHFFGSNAQNFVIGSPLDPAEAFHDSRLGGGYTGDPADGYLGDGFFGTHHVADLVGETPASALTRTTRSHQGFMAGLGETSANVGGMPYLLNSRGGLNLNLEIDADENRVSAVGTVYDTYELAPVIDNYLLTFGDGFGSSGGNTFVDDDRYAAVFNGNQANTRLRTDGGQDLQQISSENAGSYLVSGRAAPVPGWEHCQGCDFVDWGWWGTRVRVAASGAEIPTQRTDFVHLGTWVAGDVTAFADLPTNLSATYEGTALGNVSRMTSSGWATYIAVGDAMMTYDFNGQTGRFELHDYDGMNFAGAVYGDDDGAGTYGFESELAGRAGGVAVAGRVGGVFVNDGTDHARGIIGNFGLGGVGISGVGTIVAQRTLTGGPSTTVDARVLTSPGFYVVSDGSVYSDPGPRGLLGSTADSDRSETFTRQHGWLISSEGDIALPDYTGAGSAGLTMFTIDDGVFDGETLAGTVYAGVDGYTAYLLGIGGDATRPFYTFTGTPTPVAAMQGLYAGSNVISYALTQDPIRPGPVPLFANDLYGSMTHYASSHLLLVESDVGSLLPPGQTNYATKAFQSWVSIDGEGLDQKSAALVFGTPIPNDGSGAFSFEASRRGSFRHSAFAGPANMRGGVNSIAGTDGAHFFGAAVNNFALGGTPRTPGDGFADSLLGPGFTGNPTDGYLGGGYPFSTVHVANRIDTTPQASLERTARTYYGFMTGIGESSIDNGDNPYVLASGTVPTVTLRTDPTFNDVGMSGEVFDVFNGSPAVASYLLTFGSNDTGAGINVFVDDDRYGALHNSNPQNTRLRTDGGRDYANQTGDNPGSYMISGRANPIAGYQHCTSCDFLDWGWWGSRVRVGADGAEIPDQRTDFMHMGTWVAGDIANPADLPTGVVATYAGTAIGNVARINSLGMAKYVATGNVEMSYDFDARSGNLAITNFDGRNYNAAISDSSTTSQALFGGSLIGEIASGSVTGAFVNDGPNVAAGIIGNFGVAGSGYQATGTIAGARTP